MRKTVLRAAAIGAALLLALRRRRGGDRAAARPHRGRQDRRRLHADDAAQAPLRADRAARLRQDLDRQTARSPPALKQIVLWFDKHGEVETRGLPVCTRGKLRATDTRQARRHCRGRDRRQGLRQGGRLLPRIEADPGLLADHDLQRAAQARQPDRARPRLPQRARRRPPTSSRSRSRRSTPAATGSRPWPRSRRSPAAPAIPHLRPARDRPRMEVQGAAPELRQRQLPRRPAAGQRRSSASDDGTFLQGSVLKRCKGTKDGGGGMRRTLPRAIAAALAVALLAAAAAYAVTIRGEFGDNVVSATRRHRPPRAARASGWRRSA